MNVGGDHIEGYQPHIAVKGVKQPHKRRQQTEDDRHEEEDREPRGEHPSLVLGFIQCKSKDTVCDSRAGQGDQQIGGL